MLQDELDRRRSRLTQRRYKRSGVDEKVSLADFDWRFNPKLPRAACFELHTLKFIAEGANALIVGKPGCGKTWLACTLEQKAARLGFSVLYARAPRLLEELHVAYSAGSFGKRLAQQARLDLLILERLWHCADCRTRAKRLAGTAGRPSGLALDAYHQPVAGDCLARLAGRAHAGRRHPGTHRAWLAQDSPQRRVDEKADQGRLIIRPNRHSTLMADTSLRFGPQSGHPRTVSAIAWNAVRDGDGITVRHQWNAQSENATSLFADHEGAINKQGAFMNAEEFRAGEEQALGTTPGD